MQWQGSHSSFLAVSKLYAFYYLIKSRLFECFYSKLIILNSQMLDTGTRHSWVRPMSRSATGSLLINHDSIAHSAAMCQYQRNLCLVQWAGRRRGARCGARGAGGGRCSPLPWRPPPSNQLQKYVRAITSITCPRPPPSAHCNTRNGRVTECGARAHVTPAVLHRRARRHYTHLGSDEKMYRAQVSTLLRLTRRTPSELWC